MRPSWDKLGMRARGPAKGVQSQGVLMLLASSMNRAAVRRRLWILCSPLEYL